MILLLIDIFFELMIIKLFLFIPVTHPGDRVISIANIVVMHFLSYINKNINKFINKVCSYNYKGIDN